MCKQKWFDPSSETKKGTNHVEHGLITKSIRRLEENKASWETNDQKLSPMWNCKVQIGRNDRRITKFARWFRRWKQMVMQWSRWRTRIYRRMQKWANDIWLSRRNRGLVKPWLRQLWFRPLWNVCKMVHILRENWHRFRIDSSFLICCWHHIRGHLLKF